jgi:spermidine synthase
LFFNQNWLALVFGAVSIFNLFTVGVSLHSRLFDSRPPAGQLTLFYLAMSFGGVLGGIFCALIAPLIFDWTYEHLILLVSAAWLMKGRSPFERFASLWNGDALSRRLTVAGIIVVAVLAFAAKDLFGLAQPTQPTRVVVLIILAIAIAAIGNRALFTCAMAAFLIAAGGREQLELSASPGKMTRSFFGIYSIRPGTHDSRMLVHGTTLHGIQNLGSPERERMPTTYYARGSGVGLAMAAAPALFGPSARIDIVGLGAGTLACYAQPAQRWTFYEIDPAVVRIAENPQQFSFLSNCMPHVRLALGDARLRLEQAATGGADIMAVDAFSSDSIPIHLLTREAFAVYGRRLVPNGVLLIHISNRFLDLKPVVAAEAAEGHWYAARRRYVPSAEGAILHETESQWIALSRSRETIDRLVQQSGQAWQPLTGRPGFAPWTDDHASVLPLISFSGV